MPLKTALKRDRAVVLASLLGVTALAWLYLVDMALDMEGSMGAAMATARTTGWDAANFLLTFAMWAVMMVGMMLPSAAVMILLFATINRKKRTDGKPLVPTGLFALGYVAVWTGFSLLATLLQWTLRSAALLSPTMASTSAALGGLLLVGAGLYQWTPLKHACLKKCRSPLDFILFRWREGPGGALRMGLEHGVYCLGCCWVLMGLLFVGGVMNLLWVALIAVVVLAEKLVPRGDWVARIGGCAMVGVGTFMLLTV